MNALPTERPLSFATDMLRAVRAGVKTQTRRPAYPQNAVWRDGKLWRTDGREIVCPFGLPGDRLWVRERFAFLNGDSGPVVYSADPVKGRGRLQWQQSRYLPREASRMLLEVESTRAERLQSIGEADARLEGYPQSEALAPLAWFRRLWDRLTMAEQLRWDANPWVWVVKFRMIDPVQSKVVETQAALPPVSENQTVPLRGLRSATVEEKKKLAMLLRTPWVS